MPAAWSVRLSLIPRISSPGNAVDLAWCSSTCSLSPDAATAMATVARWGCAPEVAVNTYVVGPFGWTWLEPDAATRPKSGVISIASACSTRQNNVAGCPGFTDAGLASNVLIARLDAAPTFGASTFFAVGL